MTHTKSQLNVPALNSGSSSLKFGLYGVGPSGIERLLSGEAESIGDKSAKFQAKDSHGKALLSESGAIPSQREAIIRIGRLLGDSKMPMPAAQSGIELSMVGRGSGSIASLTIRS